MNKREGQTNISDVFRMEDQNLAARFEKQFGHRSSRTYFSPGRVNLIGEYTDFNGGYVLPAAIDRGTYYAVRPNSGSSVNVCSADFEGVASVPMAEIANQRVERGWSDYVKGALLEFHKRDLVGDQGVDIFVTGDLPKNSGLSSSASFTVGLVFLLNDIWDCGLDRLDIVKIARCVENDFIGLRCGIMDQFAVANGRVDHAVKLHCHTLEYELIPFVLDGYEIVITDSCVPRKLSESSYNERRAECDTALELLQGVRDIDFLCGASIDEVADCKALRENPIAFKRARHVVAENSRVLKSVQFLSENRLAEFGELLFASHYSLRDDFEVSCQELDILVDASRRIDGVLGSRMTGAGFGGCTVSIVASDAVPEFSKQLTTIYSDSTPYEASIIRCRPGDGVKRIEH